jgi:hypothetical protein
VVRFVTGALVADRAVDADVPAPTGVFMSLAISLGVRARL